MRMARAPPSLDGARGARGADGGRGDRWIARLPRELVEWALAQCPSARAASAGASLTEADDVVLDEGEPFHFAPSGCVAKTLDFRTGEQPREHAAGPAARRTALLDELPELDLMWTAGLRVGRAARAARARGVLHAADRDAQARDLRRLPPSEAGRRAVASARRWPATWSASSARPSHLDGRDRGLAAAGRRRLPWTTHLALARHAACRSRSTRMAIAGATSPVTLAGSVVEGVAEFLGAATALQVAAPGARARLLLRHGRARHAAARRSRSAALESALMGVDGGRGRPLSWACPTLHPRACRRTPRQPRACRRGTRRR